jgi:hypothetical protein
MNVVGRDDKFVETELLLSAIVFEGRKKKVRWCTWKIARPFQALKVRK